MENVVLHNRSKRERTLKNGVLSLPGRSITIPEELAEFYLQHFPDDFIKYEDYKQTDKTKSIAKENKKLKTEKALLEARIKELEAANLESVDAKKTTHGPKRTKTVGGAPDNEDE